MCGLISSRLNPKISAHRSLKIISPVVPAQSHAPRSAPFRASSNLCSLSLSASSAFFISVISVMTANEPRCFSFSSINGAPDTIVGICCPNFDVHSSSYWDGLPTVLFLILSFNIFLFFSSTKEVSTRPTISDSE